MPFCERIKKIVTEKPRLNGTVESEMQVSIEKNKTKKQH